MERREFLGMSAAASIAAAAEVSGTPLQTSTGGDDEAFWAGIRREYDPPLDYADLDQANTAPTARRVFDAYVERARRLSRAPAERFGAMWKTELDAVARPALAAFLGAAPGRVAFTSNATAALNTVLHGFPLQRGDEVIVTHHEYPDMVETLLQRARREGIELRVIRVPGASEDPLALVARIKDAIGPRTRLLLVSHVSAWSGAVLPVREVIAVARERGVAVLVDAAQSVGIVDVRFEDMGCDFLAASLHKGLGAPLPTGVLLMRAEHVGRVAPLHPPSWDTTQHPMDLYEWAGTFDVAALSTVKEALDFQLSIGIERKRARLMKLGAYWQDALANVRGVRLLTARDPRRWCGPAAFAIEAIPSKALARHLRQHHRVSVQDKAGRHSPFDNAIRVSPGAHSTFAELDRLVAAVREIARRGRLA
jgi:isopenicillin-N epimerase